MAVVRRVQSYPPTAADWGIAFFYGTLSCAWVHWLVAPERVAPMLAGTGFKPALFDGQALVNVDFQAYTSSATGYLEATNEIELNLVVYPEAREAFVPQIGLPEYLVGMEQLKILGNYRQAVSCDDLVAVYYGRLVFGENKYPGAFNYTIPNVNGQSADDMNALTLWDIQAFDSPTPVPMKAPNNPPAAQQGVEICHLTINLAGLGGRVAAPSPFVRYSQWPADPAPTDDPNAKQANGRRPAGSRWNVLGAHQLFMLGSTAAGAVKLTRGPSVGPMGVALDRLGLATTAAVSVTTFQYQPAAIEGRPFFADIP